MKFNYEFEDNQGRMIEWDYEVIPYDYFKESYNDEELIDIANNIIIKDYHDFGGNISLDDFLVDNVADAIQVLNESDYDYDNAKEYYEDEAKEDFNNNFDGTTIDDEHDEWISDYYKEV